VVEPRGSTWKTDTGTGAAATVSHTVTEADGVTRTESFREFVAIAQDDAYVNKTLVAGGAAATATQTMTRKVRPPGGNEAGNQISTRLFDQSGKLRLPPADAGQHQEWVKGRPQDAVPLANPNGTSLTANLFNYRTESVDARYQASGTFMDLSNFFSNTQVKEDPQTPVFTAHAGEQVRFRMLRPGQDDDIVMTIHGHAWQEQPWVNDSRQMGFNRLSNWYGTQQLSGNDRIEMMIGAAGGRFHVAGDYLYNGVLQAANPQNLGGMWGILRVSADAVAIKKAQLTPVGSGGSRTGMLSVAGDVARAVDTGRMASAVKIFRVTDFSPGCSLTVRSCAQELGEAAVQPDRSWRFDKAGVTLEDGAMIRVVTNLASLWPAQATVSVTYAAPREVGVTNN
jgi:hypothetical protein